MIEIALTQKQIRKRINYFMAYNILVFIIAVLLGMKFLAPISNKH
jgi:hypothetical protein